MSVSQATADEMKINVPSFKIFYRFYWGYFYFSGLFLFIRGVMCTQPEFPACLHSYTREPLCRCHDVTQGLSEDSNCTVTRFCPLCNVNQCNACLLRAYAFPLVF